MGKSFIVFIAFYLLLSCNSDLFEQRLQVAREYREHLDSSSAQHNGLIEQYGGRIIYKGDEKEAPSLFYTKLVDFQKENGEEFIRNGYNMYNLHYIATYEALVDGVIYEKDDSTVFMNRLYTMQEASRNRDCDSKGLYTYIKFAPIKKFLKTGDKFKYRGNVVMLKTDNGWNADIRYQ